MIQQNSVAIRAAEQCQDARERGAEEPAAAMATIVGCEDRIVEGADPPGG